MANTFATLLAIATLLTGIVWGLERYKWAPTRFKKVAHIKETTEGGVERKVLEKLVEPPSWVDMLASFFPILAIVFFIRSFLYEPFQIPSGSMMPTLLVGDFILVEKYAYGIKNPLTHSTWFSSKKPKRGDVIVFKYPRDTRVDYIKRVVGVAGDTVHYDVTQKVITVTPACEAGVLTCPKLMTFNQVNMPRSNFIQGYEPIGNGNYQPRMYESSDDNILQSANLAEALRLNERIEQIGDQEFHILTNPALRTNEAGFYRQPGMQVATWKVPEGHYFAMGDNRDNSLDSRYWGFVPDQNVVGKAVAIWLSLEKQEGEWPTGVRLSRIGAIH